jgi:hypothetical protein
MVTKTKAPTKRIAKTLGRSPVTGAWVLKPVKSPSPERAAQIRKAVKEVVSGRKD